MTVEIAQNSSVPVAIWAVPEPRIGGRLRLNAFCGLNLAAHALGKADIFHGSLYADPKSSHIGDALRGFASPQRRRRSNVIKPDITPSEPIKDVLQSLRGSTISVIGQHPDGFDTCSFDQSELTELSDIAVKSFSLETLFQKAKSIDPTRVATIRESAEKDLAGLDAVNQEELERSFRVFCAMEDIQAETGSKGMAVRCWPETFTEYGCAACGPMAMMNQKCVPSACEADVYGSFSSLLLQELASEPAWMADLVDLDFDDNTGVFWHCGLAPISMCDPKAQPEATIHTNRKMPLLHQFPLKPGKITIARLSQARNETKLVIGEAEFQRAPMAFTGTSGVVKFARPAREVFDTILHEGLEHHFSIAYGNHTESLRGVAASMDLPVLELT